MHVLVQRGREFQWIEISKASKDDIDRAARRCARRRMQDGHALPARPASLAALIEQGGFVFEEEDHDVIAQEHEAPLLPEQEAYFVNQLYRHLWEGMLYDE